VLRAYRKTIPKPARASGQPAHLRICAR
jgi:hypothetical protein